MSSPEIASTALAMPSTAYTKPERVLSCVSCSQRKVKCSRIFPCSNCKRAGVQCVQATLAPRQRRRRFAERDLLQQLRRYEELLKLKGVDFEHLHDDLIKPDVGNGSEDGLQSREDTASPSASIEQTPDHPIRSSRNFWNAVRRKFPDDTSGGETVEKVARRAWENSATNDDLLHFGRRHDIDLVSMHPEPVHIFKLWQTYLDNVNPLLKVVHAPTMQAHIIEAIGDLSTVSSAQTALMFSIYCVAVHSLDEEECLAKLGQKKETLLATYQLGCQQALVEAGYLKSQDRNCLTALHLYLTSVSASVTPYALSSVSGLAIRVAQRMSLHNEEDNKSFGVLEGEMRRRLWWALSLMDTRISQLAEFRSPIFTSDWDCAIPLNVNDSDLRSGMKSPPPESRQATDAIFAVVRAELGTYARKESAQADIEDVFEAKYLKHCDLSNPLHVMTFWSARCFLAKFRLFEIYTRTVTSSALLETELATADLHAIRLLEYDTKIIVSPMTKPYLWLFRIHFPGPAYVHLLKSLGKRPKNSNADRAWQVLSENYEAWHALKCDTNKGFKGFFLTSVQKAWSAREALAFQDCERLTIPRIVSRIRQMAEFDAGGELSVENDWVTSTMRSDLPYSTTSQQELPMDYGMNQFGWPSLNWDIDGSSSW